MLWLLGIAEIGVARFDKQAIFRRGRQAGCKRCDGDAPYSDLEDLTGMNVVIQGVQPLPKKGNKGSRLTGR